MHAIRKLTFGLSLALSSALLAPAQLAAAEETSKVMLVLDASGSMWGRIDGTTKIEVARDVIRELLIDWDPSIHLGLSAYGHRRKGECSDIETLVPVGPVNPQQIMSIVNSLTPVGKTPLSEAVLQAARELRYTEERATVILVSDGIETCEADPCALGLALERDGVDFTAHVIGFDLNREEADSLRCLAENTGGQFLSADDPTGLLKALQFTVTQVVTAAAPKPEPIVVAPPEPAPKKQPPQIPPGQHFQAVMVAGGEAITGQIHWEILPGARDFEGKRKRAGLNYKAQTTFKLPPGDYYAIAKWGNATADLEFNVAPGEAGTKHTLIMNAGILNVQAIPIEGADALTSGLGWNIYTAKKNIEGKRKRIETDYSARPQFMLSDGDYLIEVRWGNASISKDIKIVAGELFDEVFDLNAGILKVQGVPVEGADPLTSGLGWNVYSSKKDISGKRKRIDTDYSANPAFNLTKGKYHIIATWDNASVAQDIEIVAGELNEQTFNLNAGVLHLKASSGGTAIGGRISWNIFAAKKNIEGKRKRIDTDYSATPKFFLTEGKYFVVATQDKRSVSSEITITAGELNEQNFNFDTAE